MTHIALIAYHFSDCRLIYQTMTPKPVIILEDTSVNGFDTMITSAQEDFEFPKRIVKYLAKFHAASFYLHDEQVCIINSILFEPKLGS